MIIYALELLVILAAGIASGILLVTAYYRHQNAEREADEAALAEVEEIYAAWAQLRTRRNGTPPGSPRPGDRQRRGDR